MGLFMECLNKPNHPKYSLVIPLVITLVIGVLSHQIFANWAEIYGPIYSIKVGASTIVVLNSTDVVKEAIVSKFSSISKQKHTQAMKILTLNTIVTSDFNEYHKMARRHLVIHMVGSNAHKQHPAHRDTMMDNIVNLLQAHAKENPLEPVNFRRIFQTEVFGLTLKQALGKDIESAKYIEGLGETLSRDEIHKVLVFDPLSGAVEMDWKDFFPCMRWIPNKSFKMHVERMEKRKVEVMKTLIEEQLQRISSGEGIYCYLDQLVSEWKTLTKTQLTTLVWETMVGTGTTVVAAELALHELAKNPKHQDRLCHEMQRLCGNNKYMEEQYSEVTFLSPIFHETLRKYPPFALVLPLRYVHEDTQLGGYDIPVGTQIIINFYGCNMNKKQWDSPEKWKPERFLDSKHDPKDLYKTMSFEGGKRICQILITCTAIARCTQDFKWNLEPGTGEEDITPKLNQCSENQPGRRTGKVTGSRVTWFNWWFNPVSPSRIEGI
ncbi:hypothetical protein MKW92_008570 [Papaver armeniacum]|nr:hypothetical protein MKW92_008570 [Papaver armeniacum]